MTGSITRKLIKAMKPLIKFIGKIHWPFTHKELDSASYYLMRDYLNPGDVLLTITNGEISNLFNSGKFKHAAFYVGGEQIKSVVEAVSEGVIYTNLIDFIMSKDRIVVMRPKGLSQIQVYDAVNLARLRVGRKYDFGYDFNNNADYCSELVYDIIEAVAPDRNLQVESVAGHKIVRPDNFYADRDNFELIYDSKDEHVRSEF